MPIDESKVVRERKVKQGQQNDPEGALAMALDATGHDDYVREMHFLWCCEHSKTLHVITHPDGIGVCHGCEFGTDAVHDYQHERDWRFDFAFLDEAVAVEVEGGTWTSGRHTRGAGYEADCLKYSEAAIAGWCVVRVTARMVEDGTALELVERALAR